MARSTRSLAGVLALSCACTLAPASPLRAAAPNALGQMDACTSSIEVRFNQYGTTHIATGSTIWFSSVLEGIASEGGELGNAPIRIAVVQQRITFGEWPHVITMPNSLITLDPSTSEPQRWWTNDALWSVTYAPSQVPEAFFNGMPFTAPEPFVPGYSGPVTWTATFIASRPGVTLRWAWSAAVYSHFGLNGHLLVKPLTAAVPSFQNADPAGTPELFKQNVIAGAMGTGAPQYTGARSNTASVTACSVSNAARTLPAQPARLTPFASPVAQRIGLADGSIALAVDRCYATDLCALVSYGNGDRLAIYFEGAVRCEPYVVSFHRTNGVRAIYTFSRHLDYSTRTAGGSRCAYARTTRIVMDGGRLSLTIFRNADGSLRFHFGRR